MYIPPVPARLKAEVAGFEPPPAAVALPRILAAVEERKSEFAEVPVGLMLLLLHVVRLRADESSLKFQKNRFKKAIINP